MEQRTFGPLTTRVAAIGQGTWCIESDPRTYVLKALRRGLDLGMTHVDTAEMYVKCGGESYGASSRLSASGASFQTRLLLSLWKLQLGPDPHPSSAAQFRVLAEIDHVQPT